MHASGPCIAGTPAPLGPAGIGELTRPQHAPGQEGQDTPVGPPAHPPTERGTRTGTQAQPRRMTPFQKPGGTQAATPSPAPTTATVPQHPNLAARPGSTACTNPRRTGTSIHSGPGNVASPAPSPRPRPPDPYLLMPQYYSNPHQLHHHHPPAQPAKTGHPPHAAHYTAPHHHVYHRHTYHHHQPLPPFPPAPWYHTQPAHPHHHHHAVKHHLPPPLHGLATFGPPCAPIDPRGAMHVHQQHQGLQGAPDNHWQPPRPQPMLASTIHEQPTAEYEPQPHPDAEATTSHFDTVASQGTPEPPDTDTQHPRAPAGCPDSRPAQHPSPPPPRYQ